MILGRGMEWWVGCSSKVTCKRRRVNPLDDEILSKHGLACLPRRSGASLPTDDGSGANGELQRVMARNK